MTANIPEYLLDRLFRLNNLDRFGPATYLDASELPLITPIVEFGDHDE